MKLLLTDSTHPLGVALEHELEREPFGLLAPALNDVDWCDRDAVDAYIGQGKPNLVINTLGWADAPSAAECKLLPLAADALAQVCQARNIPLIQLSSYRVFGDDNKSKHAERDEPVPNSVVGQAFYDAEHAVTERLPRAIVLRTSWVIGSVGDNPATRLLIALQQDECWRLNSRLRGAPTALSDVARVIVGLIKQIGCGTECWGVYHYCSGDTCTEVEFAEQLAQVLEQQDYQGPTPKFEVVDEVRADEPVSAVLGVQRIRNDFGVQARTWRTTLVYIVKQWLQANPS
ncbi:SDR family oxidoreductase [Gilvimarinus polysaccharolyticus]|uniref:SDR family oxidoreductase n=1 Tax=Gilvimarinus polysaccharolyticus TaxID=863921 RepID=UPI0018DCF2B0|nr:sugar nucleotide-binding protein [Gilvimarinus polysaccharolyticus]